ncbi:ROK family transcriptional regulator [Calidithermus roseus]|uniref:N-acetylglucosamine repressor n=1 Tax=Calidithermus roseus TaxID=1644118 RepID=A0A399ES45_9DEIN|nr:ROK family transcriptional regulator [Calidithermus roseus]RIH87487.1 N-acetylglucosamine repressor [Calidithermus roseus]
MILKGDQSTVRSINRALVLNLLRQHGALGRNELAELTRLSSAAVTGVVAELIEQGLVLEARSGPPRGGRPPVLLELAYDAWHAVGVKVMEEALEIVLTNLRTDVLARRHVALGSTEPEALLEQVIAQVQTLLEASGCSSERLVGLGVGMAGVIDPAEGTCVYSPFLHWQQVPVRRLLEERLEKPVHVDNDVNALAAAEMLFGQGKGARNFAVATVGRGIGAGLVIGGEIYRGADGGAGELGHTVSEAGGRPCECGKRGCLEAYAAEPALLEQAKERFPEFRRRRRFQIAELLEAAEGGHEGIRALLAEAGERLGVALANLVNLFNPEMIVIAGEGVRLGGSFLEPMEEALRRNAFNGLAQRLQVHIRPWGDDIWARGAAGLTIQREVFARPRV